MIEALRLFAVPVFVGDAGANLTPIAESIRAIHAANPAGVSASNEFGWHSPRTALLSWPEVTGPLLDFALHALAKAHDGWRDCLPRLSAAWANVDGMGAWHSPHTHCPANWSGVFYISAAAATRDDSNGGKIELLNPVPMPYTFGAETGACLTPKDGMIVLFPGVLSHLVHPNRTSHPRVSVGFNVSIDRRPLTAPAP